MLLRDFVLSIFLAKRIATKIEHYSFISREIFQKNVLLKLGVQWACCYIGNTDPSQEYNKQKVVLSFSSKANCYKNRAL
jgi:hypothetical protein